MNSPALFRYYLLCQATKPTVLRFLLCSSPVYILSSHCAERAFPLSVCWLQLVDKGGASVGPLGGTGAPQVPAGRVEKLNHPATLRASQSDAAVKIPSSLKIQHLEIQQSIKDKCKYKHRSHTHTHAGTHTQETKTCLHRKTGSQHVLQLCLSSVRAHSFLPQTHLLQQDEAVADLCHPLFHGRSPLNIHLCSSTSKERL